MNNNDLYHLSFADELEKLGFKLPRLSSVIKGYNYMEKKKEEWKKDYKKMLKRSKKKRKNKKYLITGLFGK